MANVRISGLPSETSPSASDVLPIDGATTRKATLTAVVAAGLANDVVTTAKIADANVTTAKIADANVTAAKLASDAVTTAKIADTAVATAKIADSAVTTAKIADVNVTTAKVADGAVTAVKLASSAVADAKVATPATPADGINTSKLKFSNPTLTSPVVLSALSKMSQRVDLREYGVDLTGDNDSTTEVQRAFTDASDGTPLDLPPTAGGEFITLTAPINVVGPVRASGLSVIAEDNSASVGVANGPGSWFKLAHTGKGFIIGPTGGFTHGVEMRGIGTLREQPTPGTSYTPNNHDYDFSVTNAAVLFDVAMLNATRGIKLFNGGGTVFERVRGQPLRTGIEVEFAVDVVHFQNIHFWPYWTQNAGVWTYMLANADALHLKRCDNPIIDKFFCHNYAKGLRVGYYDGGSGGPAGTVSLLKAAAFEVDYTECGVFVEEDSDYATLDFSIFSAQGNGLGSPSVLVDVEGTNARIGMSHAHMAFAGAQHISVTGSGSRVRVKKALLGSWNGTAVGHAAFYADDEGGVIVDDYDLGVGMSGLSGPLVDGGARLRKDMVEDFTNKRSNTFKQSVLPSVAWTVDSSEVGSSIANGGTIPLPAGSGAIVVTNDVNGQAALVALGSGAVDICNPSATAYEVSSTPASGKIGIYYDAGGFYAIKNNLGSTATIYVTGLRGRPAP